MQLRPTLTMIAGTLLVAAMSIAYSMTGGKTMAVNLAKAAAVAIADAGGYGVRADFMPGGLPTRHPVLDGGDNLDEGTRAQIAQTVAAIPGMGGVRWADGTIVAESGAVPISPLHCQEDVEALLRARSIRFEESRATIDRASRALLDEVAAALRPCLGSIIAITGHTDSSGPEAGNLALSQERAEAVEQALVARGIPSDGLRAVGLGSREPVEGLAPADPANRRIDFSVIATEPLRPTPVDTPGAR
ncbi:OmpA family protein [Pseudopontixanthobacter vadosimaris]|uniref:OmpA family protein n=1 Tax=Pseudopontixanthobacter vadosimaris TaxID=2726450 RepID=UPI001472C7A1|nr:OmpA family protein [Pseudopontixanthobacter vadosimaris]